MNKNFPDKYYRVDVIVEFKPKGGKPLTHRIPCSSFGFSEEEVLERMKDRFPQAIGVKITKVIPATRLYNAKETT